MCCIVKSVSKSIEWCTFEIAVCTVLNAVIIKRRQVINRIIEKGYRNKSLTEEQKTNNNEKSRTHVRVEPLFIIVEN